MVTIREETPWPGVERNRRLVRSRRRRVKPNLSRNDTRLGLELQVDVVFGASGPRARIIDFCIIADEPVVPIRLVPTWRGNLPRGASRDGRRSWDPGRRPANFACNGQPPPSSRVSAPAADKATIGLLVGRWPSFSIHGVWQLDFPASTTCGHEYGGGNAAAQADFSGDRFRCPRALACGHSRVSCPPTALLGALFSGQASVLKDRAGAAASVWVRCELRFLMMGAGSPRLVRSISPAGAPLLAGITRARLSPLCGCSPRSGAAPIPSPTPPTSNASSELILANDPPSKRGAVVSGDPPGLGVHRLRFGDGWSNFPTRRPDRMAFPIFSRGCPS